MGVRGTPISGFFMTALFSLILTFLSYQIERLDKRMVTDYVTGLNNNRGLLLAIKKRIFNKDPCSVIYIGLENFKFLNDNYGFDFGDELRKIASKRLLAIVGKHGVVGSVDRTSFMIVLDGDCDPRQIAFEALGVIGEKVSITRSDSEIDVYLSAYAGIALYPERAKDAETLMKYSDIAMYQASILHKDRIVFYEPIMEEKLKRQVEVERRIKKALAHGYFYMVYQPQFSTEGKKLRGFEALLRLREPNGDSLSPGEFIPAAEKNDLILEITDWVLKNVLRTFADLVREKDVRLSVNVSSKNMENPYFAANLKELLEATRFPAQNLEIEITEYCLLQSLEKTIENIKALRAMGVKVALDDFGTGYTSLSYLEKLPINLLKIDKSLVDDIEKDKKSQQFVNAVIYMGHLMGCEVICEGVENEGQLELLRENKSDFIQGYVWGRPMEFEKAKELLSSC